MNLYDRARQDNSRIIGTGFTVAAVFTSPSGVDHPAECFFTDSSLELDANGMPCIGRHVMLSVNLISSTGVVQFTETNNPSTVGETWRVSFTYNGQPFTGTVKHGMFDRTFGMITMNLEKRKVVP